MTAIEQIFDWERVRQIQRDAPLLDERERFLSHMLELGITKRRVRNVASILLHAVRLLGLDRMRPVAMAEIEEASQIWTIDPKVHTTRMAGPTSAESFAQTALQWLRFHDAVAKTSSELPFDGYQNEFLRHLAAEQYSVATVRCFKSGTTQFLKWVKDSKTDLSSVTVQDIDEYLELKRSSGWNPQTVASQCSILRRFLRYAFARGWTCRELAKGIRGPRRARSDGAPKGPSWEDVRRLLAANSGVSPEESRTRAVLHLCAIYALRVSEVMNLTLDDFDWFNESFLVRRAKRGQIQQFPLQYEIGEIILSYLKNGRPRCKCRHLFVSLKPPYRRLGIKSLRDMVAREMRRLGIKSVRNGPHALRHACATHLLRQGASMREIAEFLGHRDMASVLVYAKHDLQSLSGVTKFRMTGVR